MENGERYEAIKDGKTPMFVGESCHEFTAKRRYLSGSGVVYEMALSEKTISVL